MSKDRSAIDRMPTRIGPYIPIRPLGAGGHAAVYRAEHLSAPTYPVAIKLMLPELSSNPRFNAAFSRELVTLAALRHPNIVRLRDHDITPQGVPYMVMELVEGIDLASFIREHGRGLDPDWVVLIALDLADALAHAHDPVRTNGAAVLHRDISPHNVLMSLEGDAKLTDFGIAKAVDERGETEATTQVSGKYHYMSPEQAGGEQLDARADLYSLGLVLYELVLGERAFATTSETRLYAMVREAKRESLHGRAPAGTPEPLVDVIEALLHPDREKRLPNAGALISKLAPLDPGFFARLQLAGKVGEYQRSAASRAAAAAARSGDLDGSTMDVDPSQVATVAPSHKAPAASVPPPLPTSPPQRVAKKWPVALAAAALLSFLGAGSLVFALRSDVPSTLPPTALSSEAGEVPRAEGPSASPSLPAPPASNPNPAPEGGTREGAGGVEAPSPSAESEASPTATTPDPPAPAQRAVTATSPDAGGPEVPSTPAPAAPAPTQDAPTSSMTASRPRASAPGAVRVIVSPWGNVSVDGMAHGRAPQTVTLSPGRHTVAVGRGSTEARRTVSVRSGATQTVRIDLD